jgi:hypothetical protein
VAGLPAYFLGNEGVCDAMLLPEVEIFEYYAEMPHFKRKSIASDFSLFQDAFHELSEQIVT